MKVPRRPAIKNVLPALIILVLMYAAFEYIEPRAEGDLSVSAAVAPVQVTPVESKADNTPLLSRSITDTVQPGESLFVIFQKHDLDTAELARINQAAKGVYDLRRIRPGSPYTINTLNGSVNSITCQVTQDETLSFEQAKGGIFTCKLIPIEYERKVAHIGGVIRDNLVESMGSLVVALELSDIFAWDIDFTTDLRPGDTYKAVVEELWRDGVFVKHGRILAAQFTNNGATYSAFRFERDGNPRYYDEDGKSVKRAFLKAPLSYKRISSSYGSRRHPILKTVHVHRGIDYAAPTGTPVSAVGDGTVLYAGYKGANGNLVIIKHPNGYKTYYLHLHRIAKGIRKGRKVVQGQVIGTVGSTGRATGPHLDYRIKKGNRFVNPLKLAIPKGKGVPDSQRKEFGTLQSAMDMRLDSIAVDEIARLGHPKPEG